MSWDDSTPREDGGHEGVKTVGAATASRSRRGRTDAGRGDGTKTLPPPDPPGSAHPMAEKTRRDKVQQGDRRRRRRRGRKSEPAERGTRKHTPPARLRPR